MAVVLQTFHDRSSLTVALVEGDTEGEETVPQRIIVTSFTEKQALELAEGLKPSLDEEAYVILNQQIALHEWDREFTDADSIALTEKTGLWYYLFVREARRQIMEDDDEGPETNESEEDEDEEEDDPPPELVPRRPPKTPGLQ